MLQEESEKEKKNQRQMKILVIDSQAFKNILRQLKYLGLKCVKNPMKRIKESLKENYTGVQLL